MGRIYTTRFLIAAGGSGAFTYQVPAGKLAVITSVVGLNGGAAGGYTMMTVAGTAVWIRVYQATNTSAEAAMRLPVYAGETIGAVASQLYMTLTISGYLFDADGAIAAVRPQRQELQHPDVQAILEQVGLA